MTEYSPFQKKLIERYYDHRDDIMLNRLQEIISELYLAQTDAKRGKLWSRAEKAMLALKVPQGLMEHILAARNVEVLARNVRDWIEPTKQRPSK